MTVLIKGPPPIRDVARLNINGAVQMYALLWESAFMDIRMDTRKSAPKSERRDCGGTSEWSIKGIANELHLGKATVLKAMTALLENGFISIDCRIPTGQGSWKRVFRVTPPNEIEARQYAISIMGTDNLDTPSTSTTIEWDDCQDSTDEEFLNLL